MPLPPRFPLVFAGSAILLASATALILRALTESPISPEPLLVPPADFAPNNILQRVAKLGEGMLQGPEDVAMDKDGVLYTATRDGWIKRMHRNGSWEDWKFTGCRALLGVAVSAAGGVFVCDADKGLLKVDEEGVVVVSSRVDGDSRIRLADAAVEASDGSVYFSDASGKFGLDGWQLDFLEAGRSGRLLKYDPRRNSTTVVLGGLAFANGVALSAGEDFLVVCESWRSRCLRHWLKGRRAGQTEVFIDNLPGLPDNINLAPDGSFWIALLLLNNRMIRALQRRTRAKRVVAAFPTLVRRILATGAAGAAVANVPAAGGMIDRILDDMEGKVVSFVTSALEFEGHLYLGSLYNNFVGVLPLQLQGLN